MSVGKGTAAVARPPGARGKVTQTGPRLRALIAVRHSFWDLRTLGADASSEVGMGNTHARCHAGCFDMLATMSLAVDIVLSSMLGAAQARGD